MGITILTDREPGVQNDKPEENNWTTSTICFVCCYFGNGMEWNSRNVLTPFREFRYTPFPKQHCTIYYLMLIIVRKNI
jgi:hypothetical protein